MSKDQPRPNPPSAEPKSSEQLFASGSVPREDPDFKILTDKLPMLVSFIDAAMVYRFANRAYLTWYNRSPEDVVGKHVKAIVGEEGFAMRRPFIEAALAGVESTLEVTIPRQDGSILWGDVWYLPHRTADGMIDGFYSFAFDVTARRKAEIELQRLNQRLEQEVCERTAQLLASQTLVRAVYEHSSECHAVMEATEEGSFVYREVNPGTLRLYGLSREAVIGRTTSEVLGSDVAAELDRHLAASLRLGGPYAYERKQGNSIVEAVATPVADERGRTCRLVLSARDVTERRHLEEQLRQAHKMEAIGRLTGGIAHDFNNLLHGIMGSLELLQRSLGKGGPPEAERYVRSALTSADRAAALTHRLLAFSRQQALDPRPVEANRLVTALADLLRRSVGEPVAVELHLGAGLWQTQCDPNQLESALLNLAINARDAMPAGGIVTIETANAHLDETYAAKERELRPGDYVCIAVSDTGAGMTVEVMSRAFEPFFTTKPIGQGTGLGLSMVYGFARQSEGHVKIFSEVGAGTTVKLYLPRYRGPASRAPIGAAPVAPRRAKEGEVVVVVEDEPVVRSLVVETLEGLGYRLFEARDGITASQLLAGAERVDLLVTDIGLPGLNGRELAHAARAQRPELKVLLMTGYAEKAMIAKETLETGMELITKPFALDAMAARIRGMLDGR